MINEMLKMGIISNFKGISYSFIIKNGLIHFFTMGRSKIIEFTIKLKISEIKDWHLFWNYTKSTEPINISKPIL